MNRVMVAHAYAGTSPGGGLRAAKSEGPKLHPLIVPMTTEEDEATAAAAAVLQPSPCAGDAVTSATAPPPAAGHRPQACGAPAARQRRPSPPNVGGASSSASSSCGGGSPLSPPSALRRGKYSSYPYARSDLVGGGARVGAVASKFGRGDGDDGDGRRATSCCPGGVSSSSSSSISTPAGGGAGMGAGWGGKEEEVCFPLRRPAGEVGEHGPILARTSPRSLLLRKWRDGYWAHVFPTRLLLFRSGEDFAEWRRLTARSDGDQEEGEEGAGGGGGGATEDERRRQADKLVKWSVDFDTLGVVRKKERKLRREQRRKEREERRRLKEAEKQEEQSVLGATRKSKKKKKRRRNRHRGGRGKELEIELEEETDSELDSALIRNMGTFSSTLSAAISNEHGADKSKDKKSKKRTKQDEDADDMGSGMTAINNGVLKYALLPVRAKPHGRSSSDSSDSLLHAFKLERWTRGGTSVAAAFASTDADETRTLRRAIRELVAACGRDVGRKGQGKGLASGGSGDDQGQTAPVGARSVASGFTGSTSDGMSSYDTPTKYVHQSTTSVAAQQVRPFGVNPQRGGGSAGRQPDGAMAGVKDPSRAARRHVSSYGKDSDGR